MKLTPVLLLAAASISLLVGCGRSPDPAKSAGSAAAGGPVIALVPKTLNNPFFIDMQRGAEEAARAAGVTLVVQAAERETDVERQMQIIENLIQRKVSALILAPSGSREIVPVVLKANQAGIPVLIVDTRLDAAALQASGGKTVTFIGSDNHEGGKIAGQFAVERLGGQGRVAVLEGIAGHETGDARVRGFREALQGHPGITVVASQPANWERDQGYTVFQNILQANPTVNALFAANDLMALGAVEAIAAAGKTGKVMVIGFDAQDEARAAVKAGKMAATIAQNPALMGRTAVERAVALLKGESVPADIGVSIELVK
jgi:ribose transport system substrate-binding protein